MRKYFTRRCIGLHLLVVLLVPAFLAAGWWQYHVALGGNDLSWVYTVEWPFFAGYTVYIWWRLIHDRTTMLDKLWAAKARAAADAEGRPLHEIPGWAMDKQLSSEVIRASLEAARLHELSRTQPAAIGPDWEEIAKTAELRRALGQLDLGQPAIVAASSPCAEPPVTTEREPAVGESADVEPADVDVPAIDARVLDDKVVADEELDAYNRYLAELSWRDAPKRWRPPRNRDRHPTPGSAETADTGPLLTAPHELPEAPPELAQGEAPSDE